MSITTNFPGRNYYDDLQDPDSFGLTPSDKNYLRVLFKPSYSVQTRELNQIQSILQSQIDRLGRSLYKANSAIIGGDCSIDNKLKWIDVQFSDSANLSQNVALFENYTQDLSKLSLTRTGNDSTAVITRVEYITPAKDRIRLFVQSRSGLNDFTQPAGNIVLSEENNDQTLSFLQIDSGAAIGCTLNPGAFFVKGSVAVSARQYTALALESTSGLFNGYALLEINESIITSDEDDTLFDNANDSLNSLAPGADRYKISLNLKLSSTLVKDSVVLLHIRDSAAFRQENSIDASGSTLEKILATRTFEESGDYTLKNFDIQIQEVLGDSFEARYKNAEDLTQNFSSEVQLAPNDHYVCTVSPSVAYVKGTRVELQEPLTLAAKKARVSYRDLNAGALISSLTNADIGNYVTGYFKSTSGLLDFDSANISYVCRDASAAQIGTCKILTIENTGKTTVSSTEVVTARLYLYKIELDSGKRIEDIESITGDSIANIGALDFVVQSQNSVKLFDTSINSSFFNLPYSQVKTVSDLFVSEKILMSGTTNSSGSVTFSQPGRSFDKSIQNIIVNRINGSNSTIITNFTVATGGAADSLTISGLANNANVNVICTVSGLISDSLGIKTLTTELVTPVLSGDSYLLNGVHHAIEVVNNTNWILVDDGQRANEYTTARVKYVGPSPVPTGPLTIRHWKFTNTGIYYTVNSYRNSEGGQISLSEIPKYGNIRLSDVIDTRVKPGQTNRLSLDPYSTISCKVDFYLPRRDSLVVTSAGDFQIISGSPDIDPKGPVIPDNACMLYDLFIPAYTFSSSDITQTLINNRRYTMRDIGNLDKRIGNVEYYTSLSLLEKNAGEKSLFDSQNGERFKNGFIVDGFRNHAVGDIENSEYLCSVDKSRGRLYPYHNGYSLPLEIVQNRNVIIKNNTAYLNYSETVDTDLSQTTATRFISVQPYETVASSGNLELWPEVDTWSDQTTRPAQTLNLFPGLDSVLRELGNASGLLGTDWDSTWTTIDRTSVRLPRNQSRSGRRVVTTTTQQNVGIETNIISDDINQSLGQYISDISIKPYMRSRSIWFEATALKANTNYSFFFDGVDVTSYVRPAPAGITTIEAVNQNEDDGLNEAALLEKYPAGTITSDENGRCFGVFIVPNNNNLKFSSGEKTFRITDSPRNIDQETTSSADARFISNGLGVTRNETILSTRVPRVTRERVTRTRQSIRRHDPVAQSFRITNENGKFVTAVDLFFARKPIETNKVNVQIYLVATKNGYPTSDIIPGSEITKTYDEIVISSNSSEATRFEFKQPLYLDANVEYALVIFSESPEYAVYISQLGESDLITGNIVSSQPALGVLFTSSNKTTWTANQNNDLKFVMHSAVFSQSGELVCQPVVGTPIVSVDINSFSSTSQNTGWITTSTIATVSDPDIDSIGIRAIVTPVYDSNAAIVGFNLVNSGLGYTQDAVVSVSDGAKTATFTAKVPRHRVGAINLNEKVLSIGGKTRVVHSLTLDTTTYSIDPGFPLESITNTNHSISYNNTDKTVVRIALESTDSAISPVIDLNSLSLQTRDYVIAEQRPTSSYLTRKVTLLNSSDALDAWLDINRPTSSSDVKLYARFFDENDNIIGDEWNELVALQPSIIPVNSNRDIFNEVRFSVNPDIDFVSFVLRIDLLGRDAIDVASCKDLRVIASI